MERNEIFKYSAICASNSNMAGRNYKNVILAGFYTLTWSVSC